MSRTTEQRICCDGLCLKGRHCPAVAHAARGCTAVLRLAPGVVDGPHRQPKTKLIALVKRLAGKSTT